MNSVREKELVRLLRQLLNAYNSLIPGIGCLAAINDVLAEISVPDYELINRAPIEVEHALREWYPTNVKGKRGKL